MVSGMLISLLVSELFGEGEISLTNVIRSELQEMEILVHPPPPLVLLYLPEADI